MSTKPTVVIIQQYMCVQSLSHVQLFAPMDYSPPGSSAHSISQARILESVAISFSNIYIYTHTHIYIHIYISQIIMLYTLNSYSVVCHLHLSKTGAWEKEINKR